MVKWIWEIYYTDVTTAWSSALSPELLYKQGVLAQLWHPIFSENSEHALHYTYISYSLESCTKFCNKIYQASPIINWQVLTSQVFIFSPFLQLAPVSCLAYTPLKGHTEAVKGNLLMLETTWALRALTALTAPAQPPPGPHPAPAQDPMPAHWAEGRQHVAQGAQDWKKISPWRGREMEKRTLD